MKKIALLGYLLITMVSCNSAKTAEENDSLTLNLKKGETYMLRQNTITDIKQNIQGQDIDMKMTIKGDMSFKVTDAANDVYTMDVTYESMQMKINNGFMNLDINTAGEAPKDNKMYTVMYDMLKAMTGQSFSLQMNNKGEIVQVSGMQQLYDNMLEKAKTNMPEMEEEQLSQILLQLKQSYGDEAIKSSMKPIMSIYPENSVAVNDKWQKEIDINSTFNGTYSMDFTLNNVSDEGYSISGVGNFASDTTNYSQIQNMQAKYKLNGAYDIQMVLDKESRWIKSATLKQQLDGSVAIAPNEQIPDGMDFPMSMTATTTYK